MRLPLPHATALSLCHFVAPTLFSCAPQTMAGDSKEKFYAKLHRDAKGESGRGQWALSDIHTKSAAAHTSLATTRTRSWADTRARTHTRVRARARARAPSSPGLSAPVVTYPPRCLARPGRTQAHVTLLYSSSPNHPSPVRTPSHPAPRSCPGDHEGPDGEHGQHCSVDLPLLPLRVR